jgi:hypothetical protein
MDTLAMWGQHVEILHRNPQLNLQPSKTMQRYLAQQQQLREFCVARLAQSPG